MSVELIISTDGSYQHAEKKATEYFQILQKQVVEQSYAPTLIKDFDSWKQNHIHHPSIFSLFSRGKRKPSNKEYHHYIQWLKYTGKLDSYLNRSISYLFLRDLGKALHSPDTEERIQNVVENLKNNLIHSDRTDSYSMAGLYRWSQKEGVELSVIWLINKLKTVSEHIPGGMDADQAQRKLIKIIAGVLMHVIEEIKDEANPDIRAKKLGEAIRLGYSYGLTYPFIDDLLDSEVLSPEEKVRYSQLIRTTLTTGTVPELKGWSGKNLELIRFIHSELREAFNYIKSHQSLEKRSHFLEQAYVFFHSQEVDRVKDITNDTYTNEELYIPVILKSSSSRLIARSIIGAHEDEGFENRTFLYGIYNQLADDFADMFDDLEDGAVTPYTYYWKYHDRRPDLMNPFALYWTVICHLIHNVYHSHPKTCEVILDRAINGLKRYKERMGTKRYNEVMSLFTSGNPEFTRVIQNMVKKADDVDFFDKLLRDHILTSLKNDRNEREEFLDTMDSLRVEINSSLSLCRNENIKTDPIVDAANYSLEGDGKRLRPIITWFMGVKEYGLEETAITPLLKSLEYMHTASLIFDDLPAQDNASIRRGRATLHKVFDIATAELTGLFLTQKGIEEQASLEQFDSRTVLKLIKYSTQMTEDMCKGQAMDLNSRGKTLTLEELNKMCFYKTGIAFEACLIMPAILAKVEDVEMEALKKFAFHAGIAFQIKDDLLDVEGNGNILGKSTGIDATNKSSTFVSILGIDGAKKEMWDHYCLAIEALEKIPRNISFLKHLLNYIVYREN